MRNERRPSVALTFDDGPDPFWTLLVLDALAQTRASATFFVIAPRARRYPHLIARMREEGHEVAFHCTRHVRHDDLTPKEIEDDTRAGLMMLDEIGQTASYWRTPWGVVVPATEEVARRRGLTLAGWTADTQDWRGGAPREMLSRVEAGLEAGAIVLMHDGIGPGATRDGCDGTVALVHPLVSLVRSRGLEPVTLGRLHHPPPDGNPDFQSRKPGIERRLRV